MEQLKAVLASFDPKILQALQDGDDVEIDTNESNQMTMTIPNATVEMRIEQKAAESAIYSSYDSQHLRYVAPAVQASVSSVKPNRNEKQKQTSISKPTSHRISPPTPVKTPTTKPSVVAQQSNIKAHNNGKHEETSHIRSTSSTALPAETTSSSRKLSHTTTPPAAAGNSRKSSITTTPLPLAATGSSQRPSLTNTPSTATSSLRKPSFTTASPSATDSSRKPSITSLATKRPSTISPKPIKKTAPSASKKAKKHKFPLSTHIIQRLALGPNTIDSLVKYLSRSIQQVDREQVTEIVKEYGSQVQKNVYRLHPKFFYTVMIDEWPYYDEKDKEEVRNLIDRLLEQTKRKPPKRSLDNTDNEPETSYQNKRQKASAASKQTVSSSTPLKRSSASMTPTAATARRSAPLIPETSSSRPTPSMNERRKSTASVGKADQTMTPSTATVKRPTSVMSESSSSRPTPSMNERRKSTASVGKADQTMTPSTATVKRPTSVMSESSSSRPTPSMNERRKSTASVEKADQTMTPNTATAKRPTSVMSESSPSRPTPSLSERRKSTASDTSRQQYQPYTKLTNISRHQPQQHIKPTDTSRQQLQQRHKPTLIKSQRRFNQYCARHNALQNKYRVLKELFRTKYPAFIDILETETPPSKARSYQNLQEQYRHQLMAAYNRSGHPTQFVKVEALATDLFNLRNRLDYLFSSMQLSVDKYNYRIPK